MIGAVRPLARPPYILITPLFPLAGCVGLRPPPISDLSDHVLETIHQTVYRPLIKRRHAVRG